MLWWEVKLNGFRTDTLNTKTYQEIKKSAQRDGSLKELTVERKGVSSTYNAIPFKTIIARVDGTDWQEPFKFDSKLWNEGYEITLTATDGYSATFLSSEVGEDALYFYDEKDGEIVTPGTIGLDVSTKYQVKDLESIELLVAQEGQFVEDVTLELVINNEKMSFSRDELTKTPYYIEGRGAFTTSAGTYTENHYGGIALADFINSFVEMDTDNSVTLKATDGFEMGYSFSEIASVDNGVWILAFKMDGSYMEENPGPFRGIRIAKSDKDPIPNIDGHSSPRMVKQIFVTQEVHKDFSLLVKGKMESLLDRASVQSGINCSAHKTTVQYYDKKEDSLTNYTGIPLYSVLAFGDDPLYAPHKQTDKNILAYDRQAALKGYKVEVVATDGYSIVLDSKELDGNDDVILAMYKEGKELDGDQWPLILVWDKDAKLVPQGIKAVKSVSAIKLNF